MTKEPILYLPRNFSTYNFIAHNIRNLRMIDEREDSLLKYNSKAFTLAKHLELINQTRLGLEKYCQTPIQMQIAERVTNGLGFEPVIRERKEHNTIEDLRAHLRGMEMRTIFGGSQIGDIYDLANYCKAVAGKVVERL